MSRASESVKMIYFIVNPAAGSGKAAKAAPVIEETARSRGATYAMLYTEAPGDTKRIGELIDWARAKSIICVGGDGTIQEYTSLVAGRDVAFGLIPVGSANDLLYSLPSGEGAADREGASRLRSFDDKVRFYTEKAINRKTILIDAVRVNEERCFLNIGGTGMDIQILKDAIPLKRRFGGGAYFLSLIKNAVTYEAEEMTLTIDGQSETRKYCLLAFCNGAYYGGHMRVAPPALINDGLITICKVARVPALKMMAIFPLVKPGWHKGFREVSFVNGKSVKLEFEGRRTINFDGNLWDYESPVEFKLLKDAVRFIV